MSYFPAASFYPVLLTKIRPEQKKNVHNFKSLSLNIRGIRSLEKGKALFISLNKQKADIIFLHERGLFKTLLEELCSK